HQPASPGEQLPDVKHMLPIYNKVKAAHKLLDGDAPAAEKRLRELSREAPDYLPACLFLAEALTRQKKFAESREVSEEVLKRDPHNIEVHFQLGNLYSAQQRFAEAVGEFRKFLAV